MAYVAPPELKAWMIIDMISQTTQETTLQTILDTLQEGYPNQCQKCAGTGRILITSVGGDQSLTTCDVCEGRGMTLYPVVAESLGTRYYQQEPPPEEPPQAPLDEGGDPPEGI